MQVKLIESRENPTEMTKEEWCRLEFVGIKVGLLRNIPILIPESDCASFWTWYDNRGGVGDDGWNTLEELLAEASLPSMTVYTYHTFRSRSTMLKWLAEDTA